MKDKQLFNYHTHTFRCGHAAGIPDEEYVKAAIEKGFTDLGFSDHMPYSCVSNRSDRMDIEDLEGYLFSIRHLKEKYAGKIRIFQGFECEYFDETLDDLNTVYENSDYLILGQHYPDWTQKVNFSKKGMSYDEDMMRRYSYLVRKGMETGKFLYLAHPDYFCRGGLMEFGDVHREISHEICKTAEKTGTPLEVNICFGNRKSLEKDGKKLYPYPFREFWQIASEYDVKCIYGLDAHRKEDILDCNRNIETAEKILEGLNLNFIKTPLLQLFS